MIAPPQNKPKNGFETFSVSFEVVSTPPKVFSYPSSYPPFNHCIILCPMAAYQITHFVSALERQAQIYSNQPTISTRGEALLLFCLQKKSPNMHLVKKKSEQLFAIIIYTYIHTKNLILCKHNDLKVTSQLFLNTV